METNATREDLDAALSAVNERFSGNVCFNRQPEGRGKRLAFTLRVQDSKGPGHSRGFDGFSGMKSRRLASACWHVHGYFFEALFKVNPRAVVWSRNNKITSDYGNWEDWNAGSIIHPQFMSERCDCE